jgi:membrane-associated protease RseP (regulator of RpoE activity)
MGVAPIQAYGGNIMDNLHVYTNMGSLRSTSFTSSLDDLFSIQPIIYLLIPTFPNMQQIVPFSDKMNVYYSSSIGDSWVILSNLFFWIWFVNVNLAIFNSLPIYPLDGGYAFRVGLRSLRKRDKRYEEKYRCKKCGFLFDPELSQPPKMKLDELPKDWVCPSCKSPKEKFESIDPWEKTVKRITTVVTLIMVGTIALLIFTPWIWPLLFG